MDRFNHIDTWVFDLDNTLYDAETGLMDRVGDRMTSFVAGLLNVSQEEANRLRREYWEKHGTTLRGLMMEHKVDPAAFLQHAHDLDISDIPQCLIIRNYLQHLPGRKVIFTNAPRHFATRMTAHLGIDHHFSGMFAIEDTNYLPKPQPAAYQAFLKKFAIEPKNACMLDDMEINLKPAHDLGMKTVWLHGKNEPADHPHTYDKAEKLADWLKRNIKR